LEKNKEKRRYEMSLGLIVKQVFGGKTSVHDYSTVHIVKASPKWLWQALGWVKQENAYKGFYRTVYGSYKGHIVEIKGSFEVFILNPPEEVKFHPKWSCFAHAGDNWFFINQKKFAKDVDGAIVGVQKIIEESFQIAMTKR
jgi:hypothetical protein